MSYQVLARKWRPNRFSDVVGQKHVLAALENGLKENRLHHAYLFSGTRGVGKTSIARLFAKGLNCETGITSEPCGKCENCLAIEQGNFVDLIEIDAASRTKVEDTRELLDNVQYKPVRGRFKVYLIDEVHMLSRHSFNALLKTLEEPPEYVKFLLATTDPQKLPITVLSRCMQFHLKALEQQQISQHLAYILTQENIPYDQIAIDKLAKAAKGSIRDGLSLTDQAIAVGNGKVTLEQVNAMLGLLDNDQAIELLQALAQANGELIMKIIENVASKGADWEQLLIELAEQIHHIALLQLLPNPPENSNSQQALLAKTIAPEDLQFYYQLMLNGRKDLAYAPDRRIGIEMTMLRALAFHPLNYKQQISPHSEQAIENPTPIPPTKVVNKATNSQQTQVVTPHSAPASLEKVKAENPIASNSPLATAVSSLKVLKSGRNSDKNTIQKKKSESLTTETTKPLQTLAVYNLEQDKHLSPKIAENIPNNQPIPSSVNQVKTEQPSNSITPSNTEYDDNDSEELSAEEYRWEWINPELENENQTIRPSEIKQAILQEKTPELIEKIIKLSEEQDNWAKLISDLNLQRLLRQFALNSVLLEQSTDNLKLGLRSENKHLNTPSFISELTKAIEQYYGRPIKIDVSLYDGTKMTPLDRRRLIYQQLKEQAQTALQQDPKLQLLQQAFSAELDLQSIRPVG